MALSALRCLHLKSAPQLSPVIHNCLISNPHEPLAFNTDPTLTHFPGIRGRDTRAKKIRELRVSFHIPQIQLSHEAPAQMKEMQ